MVEKWDIFISYKHKRFFENANYLQKFLNELDIHVWLDQYEIEKGIYLELNELKRIIESAVRNSKLVVFYETSDQLEIDYDNKSNISFNWQIFENQFAKEVIFVIPKKQGMSCIRSARGEELLYYDLPHLAYILGIIVDANYNKLVYYWEKYFSMIPDSTRAATCIHKYHELGRKGWLPSLIDPKSPNNRANFVQRGFFSGRKDINKNNLFVYKDD